MCKYLTLTHQADIASFVVPQFLYLAGNLYKHCSVSIIYFFLIYANLKYWLEKKISQISLSGCFFLKI